ncbi:MAG: hypothetical protein KBD48_01495 [Candidatus Pacebacteria bacterium]|nr:hypothetical protein [Candidatus Paceibacterota bacterium]MBP9715848.1 hypothetical protein [Candidatus Paceibacterota bacterium]
MEDYDFFKVNENLMIQIFQNLDDELEVTRLIPAYWFLVKVRDENSKKETFFHMTRERKLTVIFGTNNYSLLDEKTWNSCLEKREFLKFYEKKDIYQALWQDCQENYEKIIKQQQC